MNFAFTIMPWGMGGGPWWGLQWSDPNFRKFWAKYGWRCWRYPFLPRGWWTFPEELKPEEEKEMLIEELKALKEEMKAIKERLKELETKKK